MKNFDFSFFLCHLKTKNSKCASSGQAGAGIKTAHPRGMAGAEIKTAHPRGKEGAGIKTALPRGRPRAGITIRNIE